MLHLLLMAGRTAAAFLALPFLLAQDYAAPNAKVDSAPGELTAAAHATPQIFRAAPVQLNGCTLTVSGPTSVRAGSYATYTVSPYNGPCVVWYGGNGPVTTYSSSVTLYFGGTTGQTSVTAVYQQGCTISGNATACGVLYVNVTN